ncbi:hypothetical protein EDB19DRAFT_1839937 [Suillus lakei]|nr:hypothetical protein EDB19DRAFT_1839937 [Suillus lakei]
MTEPILNASSTSRGQEIAGGTYNVQSRHLYPHNGAPFAFILYADKTHLSSAGTVKAYPVIACCGNLPVEIRNVDGPGGGRLVGWLPITQTRMAAVLYEFKEGRMHKSFKILLETLSLISKTGFAHQCYDGILRWLLSTNTAFICRLRRSQCVMALDTRVQLCMSLPYLPCPEGQAHRPFYDIPYPPSLMIAQAAVSALWNMDRYRW